MASGYRRGARGGSGRGDWAGGVRGSAGAPPAGPGRISGERRVGDMPKSPSSQYGLKAQKDIDPRGIRVTNGPMR